MYLNVISSLKFYLQYVVKLTR